MDTPPAVESPASCNCACTGKLKIAVIASLVLGIILPLLGWPVGALLLLAAIVCSILCIVKGAKVFGIVMLIVTILIGGPASCVTSLAGNKDARAALSSGTEQIKQQVELSKKLQEAQAKGDMKAVQEIQAQMQADAEKFAKEMEKLSK